MSSEPSGTGKPRKTSEHSHLDPPANGQTLIFLTGLLEVFFSEIIMLATVSDTSAGSN